MVNQVAISYNWQLVNNFEAKMVRRKHISHVTCKTLNTVMHGQE